MKTTDQAISEALRFDPLGQAERLTGKSYKECEGTSSLGMLMHIEHGRNKRALLEFSGDTHFGMSFADFKALLPGLGFTIHHSESFKKDGEDFTDELILAFDPKRGALLTAHSYGGGRSINSGTVYFNWQHTSEKFDYLEGCSHGPIKDSLVRDYSYDIREGLAFKLREADERGSFVIPWIKRPFLWLLTYKDSDAKGYDYNAINKQRLAALPASVLKLITPTP
jgi:hypothetical protein